MGPGHDITEKIAAAQIGGSQNPVWRRAKILGTTYVCGVLVVSTVLWLSGTPVVGGIVWFSAFVVPLCAMAVWLEFYTAHRVRSREMVLADGVLTATFGDDEEEAELARCCWFRGKLSDDDRVMAGSADALIVVMPTGRQFALGLDDEIRQSWIDAFASYGSREVLRSEGGLGMLVSLAMIIVFLVSAFGSLRICEAALEVPRIQGSVLGSALVVYLGLVVPWICAVLPAAMIPGWRRFTKRENSAYRVSACIYAINAGAPCAFFATANAVATVVVSAILWLTLRKLADLFFPISPFV